MSLPTPQERTELTHKVLDFLLEDVKKKPYLLGVSGYPKTGVTTLAQTLAEEHAPTSHYITHVRSNKRVRNMSFMMYMLENAERIRKERKPGDLLVYEGPAAYECGVSECMDLCLFLTDVKQLNDPGIKQKMVDTIRMDRNIIKYNDSGYACEPFADILIEVNPTFDMQIVCATNGYKERINNQKILPYELQ